MRREGYGKGKGNLGEQKENVRRLGIKKDCVKERKGKGKEV